jgi:catechol 2,3-dioxygenase-like lactoylglutathione lyase family enzyme
VSDLRAAEAFYCRTLGLELRFREGVADGEWGTVPAGRSWDEIDAAAAEVAMLSLGRDEFTLALFHGEPSRGTVFEICLGLPAAEIAAVAERLPEDVQVDERRPDLLRFWDPFEFRWALQVPESRFQSSGEIAGRWLPV